MAHIPSGWKKNEQLCYENLIIGNQSNVRQMRNIE